VRLVDDDSLSSAAPVGADPEVGSLGPRETVDRELRVEKIDAARPSPNVGVAHVDPSAPPIFRFLPQVIAATALLAVFPTALVWWLQGVGVIRSTIASALLATILSIGLAYCAERFWRTRSSAGDLLFSELMIGGWARRWRIQRQLTDGQALF
jgi:hypothetical protein